MTLILDIQILIMHERISVITIYDHTKGTTVPYRIKWQGRVYTITKFGFHHTRKDGAVLCHIFSVLAGSMYFCLNLNTVTLSWSVEKANEEGV